MRKFESSQKDESRAQSADSSKAYRKPRAFICCLFVVRKRKGTYLSNYTLASTNTDCDLHQTGS